MREMRGKRKLKALAVPPAQSRRPRLPAMLAKVLPPSAQPAGTGPVPGSRLPVTALPERARRRLWAAPGWLPGSSSWEAS